jgi:hypothetical protein
MQLYSLGGSLRATQAELLLTNADGFPYVGVDSRALTHCRGRSGQALGGIVRLAVSATRHFKAPTQPTARGPIRVAPIDPQGPRVVPAVLLEAAHEVPCIVRHPLQPSEGGIPRVSDAIGRVTRQAMAGIAEQLQRQVMRGGAPRSSTGVCPSGIRRVRCVDTSTTRARPAPGLRAGLAKPQARPASPGAQGCASPVATRMSYPRAQPHRV